MPCTNEAADIKGNLKQIEEYARKNYVSRLREFESVYVEFGEPDPRRWNYSMEKDLLFGVNHTGEIWFRTGGLTLYFNPPAWCSDRSIYDSWPFAKELILRWPQVKQKMEAAVTKLENERNAVLSFSADGDAKTVLEQTDFAKVEPILHKYKMEALEKALQDSGKSVEELMQEYLISLYSEKVPFAVQQSIRERIDSEHETEKTPDLRTASAKGHRHGGVSR